MIKSLKKEIKNYINKNQTLKEVDVQKNIEKILPQKIKPGIEKITIKEKMVIIKTKTPSWRQETEFFKKEIMKKIDKNFRNYRVEKITIL